MVIKKLKAAPLSATFMAVSILGVLIAVFYIKKFSLSWSFALTILFLCMLIASMISMEKATPDKQLLPIPRK